MILNIPKYLYSNIAQQFIISHLEKKILFDVVSTDKIGKKFKNAVNKEYNGSFCKDADYILRLAEIIDDTEDEKTEDIEKTEDTEDTKNTEGTEDTKDNNEEKEVNESVKIQDLTSSMLLSTKTPKNCNKGGCDKNCKCNKKDETQDKDESTKDKVEEAETEAKGAELKLKVSKAIAKALNISDNEKVELFDLKDFISGYNIYFGKISLKLKEDEIKSKK